MENLKQISQIVKAIKLRASDLITVDQNPETKISIFYNKILTGDFLTDNDAAHFFYKSGINNSSYKNLKSTFRNRLVDTLIFFTDSKKLSSRENATIYCSKYMAAAKILITLNIRQPAVDLSNRVLKKALYFEFTDSIIQACTILRSHFAIRVGNSKKFDYYNDLLNYNFKVKEAELLAGEYYLKILMPYIKNKAFKPETLEQANEAHQKLRPYLEKYASPYLHFIGYYIESIIHQSSNDYLQTIEVCKKALAFFDKKEYQYNTAIKGFLHQQILCYTQLKMYEEGKNVIENSTSILRPGSYSWYVNLDLYLILAIHSKKYQEAYFIYNKAVNHKGFKNLNTNLKEKWQIYKAYIYFLIDTDQLQPIRDDERFSKFRMGKFLNSVPTFSKDKRGLNIPILVIQIVLTIIHKDYNKAISRIEAIEKYRSRYLRKDENFRSNCFIKMLLQIPISGFHKAGIKRRTEKYFNELKTVPMEIAKQANEVEIIPYENLWDIIIEALDNSFYKSKK